MSLADRLKYARSKAGLTLHEVAGRTEIGESSLSEYETGKRAPRLTQLQALADAYRRSIAFFLAEGEPAPEVVLWRERPCGSTAPEIEGQFLRLCEQYHNLEVWAGDQRTCLLPRATGHAASYTYREAEGLAKQVRAALELGDRPGESLLWVLEEVCGVKVFHLSFEPTGPAACTVSETYGPAILLNAQAVRWRRNFDLAHELFHVLTWPVFRGAGEGDGVTATEQEEKFATCFAGNLLMPVETVKQALESRSREGKIAFKDLFDVARQFDVSVEALFWRMKFLYNRSEEETRGDIAKYQTVGRNWEVGRTHDQPPSRPLRFQSLAVRALREGRISQGRFAEYMDISRREAAAYIEQEAPVDEEVTLPAP